jgi:hypothetical protein
MKEIKKLTQEKTYADLKQAVKKSRAHGSDWEISSNGMSLYVVHHFDGDHNCICLSREAHIEHPYEMESGDLIFKPDERDTKSERLLHAIDGLTTIFTKAKVPHVITTRADNTFGQDPHEEALVDLLKERLGFYEYAGASQGYCVDLITSSKTVKMKFEAWKNKKIGEKSVYERLQERVKKRGR